MKTDPRTIAARERLGLDDVTWHQLLRDIERVPHWHTKATAETQPERLRRRARIAERMRELAAELEADPDTANLIPVPREGAPPYLLEAAPTDAMPSLAAWLAGTADELDERPVSRGPVPPVTSRKGASLRAFAIRQVYGLIEQYAPARRARNVETALLVSALLDEDVSANDVTQVRRAQRRRYWRD